MAGREALRIYPLRTSLWLPRPRDEVRYAVAGGAMVRHLFVRREVEAIFSYRTRALFRLLGPAPPPP